MATFTIYLLRDSVATAEDAVVAGTTRHLIAEGPSEYGVLFTKQNPPKPPKWAKLFAGYVAIKDLGKVQLSSAVFIVKVDKRLFALTFGQGRFIIKPEAYEERFGLLVTLNSVKSDALRSIDKRTFVDDQNSRVQTSQASAALDFGVDIERDLIRGIVGRPDKEELGRKMAGADALTVTADVDIPALRKLLRHYLKAFQSDDYKKTFPWVDQVRQLRPKGELAALLNDRLVEILKAAWQNNGLADDCWLAVPDIVDWSVVHGFKFTRLANEGVSTDLHLPGLVHQFPDETPSIEFLRMHHAMSVNEEEHVIDRWPVYRCIHCELEVDGKSYVLSAGHWFEVDKDFVKTVADYVDAIPRLEPSLPIYNHADEDHYNKDLVDTSNGHWTLMDKKMLPVGGIYDKVELCDAYAKNVFLHVKHYGSSSVLGHLFNQGLVSGELLKTHEEFVELANQKLGATHQLVLPKDVPRDVTDYVIVFAIISQSQKAGLHMPFFAKVVLKSVCTRLLGLGFGSVMLSKISCDPDVLIKKLKPGKQPKKRAKGKFR
ncbi:DUF6119 family protein [Pseudoxanthomonas sacheonensis]|uniref:DUF6119 family protein n=1 Tax=Pseudoxanthomonas sacheonensis TaxID=443615 RepID=UPI0013CFF5CA|nr:DUF6119 family protein [Pseudoxanthomonas sacheonensis]KAF1708655.1 hypothetical protein CSC73_08145 [Pseudoxanthomonas sacheonensis]